MSGNQTMCARCGARPVAARGWSPVESAPGDAALCTECQDLENGRAVLDMLSEAGVQMDDVDRESDADVATLGRGMRGIWSEASADMLAALENSETPEGVQAFADYLRALGDASDAPPSPAVQAFLDRHPPVSS